MTSLSTKEVEQALRASERRLRLIVENSPSAIAMFDREMRYLMTSRRWLRDYGLGDQNIIGRSHYDVFPEISDRWKAIHARCLAGVIERCDEDPFPRADGTVDWVRWIIHPWENAVSEIGGIIMFTEVITERKREQDALRESEERYRSLTNDVLDTSLVGISIIDAKSRVIWTNQTLERFLGFSRNELIGADLRQLVRQRVEHIFDESDSVANKILGNDAKGNDLDYVEFHVLANGKREERWLEYRSQPIRSGLYAGGRIQQFYDITKRRQADDALREERNFVSAILTTIGALVVVLDRKGRIVRFNRACEEATGYTFEEVKGRNLWDLFLVPEELERVKNVFDELSTGLFPNRHINHWTTKQGALRLIDWSNTTLVDEQGVPLYVIGTGIDITERRAAEEALIQAQKMQELGQLTGGVAHDFNNLLTVIIGNLQMLEERIGEDPLCTKFLQGAFKASTHGAGMIRKLLTFSRRQPLRPTEIDLNQLMSATTDLLQRALGGNIEIVMVKGDALWKAMADPGQVETTLLNLAVNARDAMPHGGKLTIETADAHLDETYALRHAEVTAGEYVMLAVSDTGCGMPPEIIAHAFDPFFTTKDAGKGSGLGLSMVYGFAMQSSGHVKIYSEPGIGTTVKLYLPRTTQSREIPVESTTRTRIHTARGETILVVEDDEEVRNMAVMILTDLGYRVLDAVYGRSALDALEHNDSIDLLFLDLVMLGGMSGFDVACEAQRVFPNIKVLFTTGYTENALNHQNRLREGTHLLPKPYTKEDLARKLRSLLDTDRALS